MFFQIPKTNEVSASMGHDSAELAVEIRDDLDNTYSDGFSAGGGGTVVRIPQQVKWFLITLESTGFPLH